MEKLLEALKKRGLEIKREIAYEHQDTPAGRMVIEHEKPEIRGIHVPLSDEEWCDLCMREGNAYLGGCCGQTGQIQDVVNNIFRDSGWIDPGMAHELIAIAASHDGFEILREKNEAKLLEAEAGWDSLPSIGKIILCVAAAIPFMKPERGGHTVDSENPLDAVGILYKSAGYISWKELFRDKTEDRQRHGNLSIRVARMVPAARAFLDQAAKITPFPFKGFAIADPEKKISENGMGYAIFETKNEADDLLEAWKKNAEEKEKGFFDNLSVKRIEITLEKGIEFLV